jgi:hypothetical protein
MGLIIGASMFSVFEVVGFLIRLFKIFIKHAMLAASGGGNKRRKQSSVGILTKNTSIKRGRRW